MSSFPRWIVSGVLVAALSACSLPSIEELTEERAGRAQMFEGLGSHARPVTTSSSEAQRYFDQGLNWLYAFNHGEAIRSFSKAAELDPGCAMAWWGIALCEGPNYNDTFMTPERNSASWGAIQKALACLESATPAEAALIEALATRYTDPAPDDRAGLDEVYANAMADVYAKYPDDSDIGTLYADAMMVRMPWKLYDLEFKPAEDTPRILEVLEVAMARAPKNPGPKHLYIHATEPSEDPTRGLRAADELRDLAPAAGHLQHMPSHTYVKTGHWDKAVVQNGKAMRADDEYRIKSPEQTIQHGYMAHNTHMLAFAAMMSGREKEAMAAARELWSDLPGPLLKDAGPFLDNLMCTVYDVQKRFGRWDDLLAEPAPPKFLPMTNAVWRAHRSIAYAAKQEFESAEREYEAFKKARKNVPANEDEEVDPLVGTNSIEIILEISNLFVPAEIHLQKGEFGEAARLLEEAAELEDTLAYGEPPQWLQPVRHTLGVVYLQAGRNADAERVYREDLRKWPNNGWSLYGLSQALERQGKEEDARRTLTQYEKHWSTADAAITTSCICVPKP